MQVKKIIIAAIIILGILLFVLPYYNQKSINLITVEDVNEAYLEAKNGSKKSIKFLIKSLESPNKEVQKESYNYIIKVGKPAVPLLIKLLYENNPSLQEYGAAALGSIKDKEALPALIENLSSPRFQRKYVLCWSLGEFADPSAAEPLINLYAKEKEDVQKYIMRAVVKIGKPAVPVLLKYLESSDLNLQKLSILALGQISGPNLVRPILKAANAKNKDSIIISLGDLANPEGIDFLLESLNDPDWQIRQKAAQSLTRFTEKRAIPALKAALNDEVVAVREWAAKAIECISGEKCLYKNEKGQPVYPYSLYH